MNFLRVPLNVTEGLAQGVVQMVGGRQIPVAGRVFARVIPNPLRRVNFKLPIGDINSSAPISAIQNGTKLCKI